MYKKENNSINHANADNLAGGTELEPKTGPASGSADFKTVSGLNSLSSGDNPETKAGYNYSYLSGKLYLLILIGLSAAVLLLLSGFGLNFLNGARNLDLGSLQERALNPADLIDAIKNNQIPASLMMGYAGLFAIILVPAAGLIYVFGYFTFRKKFSLALTAAGVLLILIMSAVIGLLKS